MLTNEIKSGTKMILKNGWYATMMDNKKGNTRLAEVSGFCKEIGSIYVWDIDAVMIDNQYHFGIIELTDKQTKAKKMCQAMFR
jgi:hypothetical protein